MKGMRMLLAVLALVAFSLRPLRAEAARLLMEPRDSGPMLGEHLDGAVQGTVQPAYRFVEGISDGVYEFVRVHMICGILPGRFTRNLQAAPGQDSGELFAKNLSEKEGRFLQRMRETYPVMNPMGGPYDPSRLQEWRSWAAEEQTGVALNALTDTLLQRYQLNFFGRSSETYARDRRNWDPGFLTMASLVGGTIFYFNGMHATVPLDDWRLTVDLRPGQRLQRALRNEGTARRLASLELGYKAIPLTAAVDWGVDNGQLRNESVGVKYRLRY